MATVSRENIGLLHDKLTVNVTTEDYLKNFDNSLKKYAKTANMPGFRKGMVPTGLVKKMYGQGVFTEEVIRVAENELSKYLETEKLNIFAQPLPLSFEEKLDMNNPTNYNFSFEIGLQPEININPQSYNVTRYVINVDEEMVDEEINRLRARFGKMTNPEVVSTEEDMLNIKFNECDANGNIIESGVEKEDSVLLKYFTPEYRNQLMGKKVNDTFVTQINKAFEGKELDFVTKDLGLDKTNEADLSKYFLITITKIGFVEKAELNEDFYLGAFPNAEIKTESELRAFIKDDITRALEKQSQNQLHDQLYHALLDNTTVELPETFLKHWLQANSKEPKTNEQIEQEYPQFANSLKWSVINAKVVANNNITVETEDLKNFARQQLFSYMGMSANLDGQAWVEDYLNRMIKDKKFVEDAYYQIQGTKMFEALAKQVSAKEENISYEDFAKKLHHHHH